MPQPMQTAASAAGPTPGSPAPSRRSEAETLAALRGRDLRAIADLDGAAIAALLSSAAEMKRAPAPPLLAGRALALLFEKPSLRTRVSFERAMQRLGGHALTLTQQEVRMGEREPVRDVARVLSGMVHGIAARTFRQDTVDELAEWADIPVINALSDAEHPCQALADLLTLRERFGVLEGLRLVYLGEGNNVATSLAEAAVASGMHFVCVSPPGYGLPAAVLERVAALPGGGSARQESDPRAAAADADALYTDVWASMGEEHLLEERRAAFAPYQLNAALVACAPAHALVMHDLPAHRGEEITDEVLESPRAVAFQQAENRMHAQQAVLAALLAPGP